MSLVEEIRSRAKARGRILVAIAGPPGSRKSTLAADLAARLMDGTGAEIAASSPVAEVVHRLGPWKTADAVEWETPKWVDWFNNRRLLQPIGNIPPAEAEENFYAQRDVLDTVA